MLCPDFTDDVGLSIPAVLYMQTTRGVAAAIGVWYYRGHDIQAKQGFLVTDDPFGVHSIPSVLIFEMRCRRNTRQEAA